MDRGDKRDRNPGNDLDVPSEIHDREAQDRAKPTPRSGGAKSPVDSQHVDSPRKQDNERGHRANS
jgi:hypothetical protein